VRAGRVLIGAAFAVVLLGFGCKENVTAPGSCPDLCPSTAVSIVDTTFTGIVVDDSSFRGYYSPQEAQWLVLGDQDSLRSVALVRFGSRGSTWYPGVNDTAIGIGRVDSVVVTLYIAGRDTLVPGIRILAYRLPVNWDTAMTWADAQHYLADSLLVDSLALPDTVRSGSVTLKLGTHALDAIPESDGGVISLAFAIHASQRTILALSAAYNSLGPPVVSWYVHAPAPRDTLSHVFSASPDLNTFVYDPPASDPPGALVAGGVPSARSILRLRLPAVATDSLHLVRATLILTPTRPARGIPSETFRVSARGVLRDFGPKSVIFADTAAGGTVPVARGDSGEIRIEVGRLFRQWGTTGGDSLPRTLMLLAEPEAGGLGEVAVARRTGGAAAPRLRVTYVRPYTFGVP